MNNDLTLNMKIISNNSIDMKAESSENVNVDMKVGSKETDPIFRESPAYTITYQDIEEWDNKSDFSGNYEDLTNKPLIPTKTTQLTNDSGFINRYVNNLSNYTLTNNLSLVALTGDYNDLINKPIAPSGAVWGNITGTLSDQLDLQTALNNKQNLIDSNNKLNSDLIDDTNSSNKFVTSSDITTWNSKSDFSGSYEDLTNKPTIPVISDSYNTSTANGYSQNYINSQVTEINADILDISTNLTDYVIFGYASYKSSVTLNANAATELSVSLPTINGYKPLACLGGRGNGNTGLLIQQSLISNNDFNRWVTNVCNDTRTYQSIDFLILYIKNI